MHCGIIVISNQILTIIVKEAEMMKKIAFYMMIITIGSKILGFIRNIVLSYFYGASNITDVYLISKTIPSFMFMFIGTAIVTGYIPIYTSIEEKKRGLNTTNANLFTENLVNVLLVISTVIIGFVLLFTPQIVKIFASGFLETEILLASTFTRVNIFTLYVTVLIYIFKGFLQIKNNYLIPAAIGFPLNLVIIISIVLSAKFNILVLLPIGYLFAEASQFVLMIPYIKKNGYKHGEKINFNDRNIKRFFLMVIPVIIGVSVNEINVLVDRTLASRISVGGISALSYARQINLFVQGIFVLTLAAVMYPQISKMAAKENFSQLKKTLNETLIGVCIFIIPSTFGFLLFSDQIVSLLYGRGAFDLTAIKLTSGALFFYSIGMIGIGFREILTKTFYSLKDTKRPMTNAALGMGLNVILNIVLSRFWGINGLALATSISSLFTTVLLFKSLRKKIGPFGMKQISITFFKILFASLVMGVLAKLSFNYLTTSFYQNPSLLIAIGIGAISYFVIIYFMKIEDVDVIVGAIKKKFGRGVA